MTTVRERKTKTTRLGIVQIAGIQRDEILFPTSSVRIEASEALEPEMARRAVGVIGTGGGTKLNREQTVITWTPPDSLEPGRHVFSVGPLISKQGGELFDGVEIPFVFVASAARIPRGIAVESVVRIRPRGERLPLDKTPRGRFIELIKATRRADGKPVELAFDETGARVDGAQVINARAALDRGPIHPALTTRLGPAKPNEMIPVAVWSRDGGDLDPDLKDRIRDTEKPPAEVVAQLKATALAARRLAGLVQELGAKEVQPDEAAPVVYARMKPEQIRRLAKSQDVARIFLYEPDGMDDLGDSIAIANSNDVHDLGVDGSGVRVAVWENGPTSNTDLDIEDRYTTSPSTSDHSQNVHAIIKNVEDREPHGHAPDGLLYSANSKDLAALRWAVRDRSCTVINQSFHRSSEPGSGDLSFDDVYKDWLILHWPYPTICQAAGNYWEGDADDIDPPSDEYVNHKGFNSLAVGNHNDAATAMDSSSVFRNPNSTHGDRELPEISANGTGVEADGITMTGTSQASPAVAGIAALLQDTDSTLKLWPEGCRAILMAGATRNIVDDTWWQDVVDADDASDGTGAVNALESHLIAQQRKSRNTPPSRRGWDAGKLTSADFDSNTMSNFTYRVQVPSFPRWGPRHVKVALAWDSKVTSIELPLFGTLPLTSRLTVDLDLKVFDQSGSQVGYSGSWDNSYEIAEFDASPGGTYEIRIRRWSGTDWTWFGIAWTVTGGLLDLITLGRVNPSRVAEIITSLDEGGDG